MVPAPRHLLHVAVKVLVRHPMVDADDLALEQCPHALNGVRVSVTARADVLTGRVIHRVMSVALRCLLEGAVLIGHQVRARRDVGVYLDLQGRGLTVVDMLGTKLAVTLDHAEDNGFAGAALRAGRFLVGMLVLLLAADVGRVGLNSSVERRVEGRGSGSMAEAMQDEPSRLLRDLEVLGEGRGGDALGVVRDEPDGHEPLAERQLRVLEDRADLHRKPRLALAALESLAVAEVIDAVATAVRAELAVAPADRAEMVDAGLLVREGVHEIEQAVEVLHHGRTLPMTRT